MTLALFDLDNTLLSGDSDYEWGQFLVSKGLVDPVAYEAENQRFYGQYRAGTLDILEYSAFSFGPLSERSMEELATLHREFMAEVIEPILPEKSQELVAHHRAQGHTLMVITATNSFITRPIVSAFGIEHLLATEPKIVNGRYTREVDGAPCFQHGKVTRLQQWLADHAARNLVPEQDQSFGLRQADMVAGNFRAFGQCLAVELRTGRMETGQRREIGGIRLDPDCGHHPLSQYPCFSRQRTSGGAVLRIRQVGNHHQRRMFGPHRKDALRPAICHWQIGGIAQPRTECGQILVTRTLGPRRGGRAC